MPHLEKKKEVAYFPYFNDTLISLGWLRDTVPKTKTKLILSHKFTRNQSFSGPETSQTPVDPLSPTQSCGVWEIHRAMVICPELKQLEDSRVVDFWSCREPAEFSGVFHEWEVSPAKGKDAGGELHRLGGRVVWVECSVTVHTGEPGTRQRGTSFGTLYLQHRTEIAGDRNTH